MNRSGVRFPKAAPAHRPVRPFSPGRTADWVAFSALLSARGVPSEDPVHDLGALQEDGPDLLAIHRLGDVGAARVVG